MIDLDALVSLRAVDRHGSVIAASEMLGYTPSAVSQQVKRLERQVGVPLLERVGRGVMLTGPGRQLVDDGSRLLGDLERIEAGLHRTAGTVAGHLRLAAFSTAVRGLVAPAAAPPRSTRTPSCRSPSPSASRGTPSTWSPPVTSTSAWCTAGATCRSRCPST